MNKKVRVLEVKFAPDLKQLETLSGIRDKAAAEAWGAKHGHAVVYFMVKKQRVFAEKLLARVDEAAKVIEDRSKRLRMFAEGENGIHRNASL